MTNRISGYMKFAIFLTVLAFIFASAPANARPQLTTAAAAEGQSTQTQQTAGQDKDQKKEEKKDDKKEDPDNPKNDRIFMVVPNYATVEHPTASITRLTAKQKFKIGAEDAFDTYSVPLALIVAAIAQARNEDESWGQGWGAYGKRAAAGYADTVTGSFMTTAVFPSLLREDPRYFRKEIGSKKSRSLYAMKRIFVIRTDSGRSEFNFSEFGGNAAAAGISLTYHSSGDRNLSSFGSDYLTQIVIDVIANQLKEFWPDIRHKFMKK
jgi:opacity protein-like surface antigen